MRLKEESTEMPEEEAIKSHGECLYLSDKDRKGDRPNVIREVKMSPE